MDPANEYNKKFQKVYHYNHYIMYVDYVECGVSRTLHILSKKWMFLILLHLYNSHEALRFSDLREAIPGITAKVLSERLKELEEEGIVHRCVLEQSTPPKTQYSLTPCGIECVEIIKVTKKWTLNWKEHPDLCPVYQERQCPL